PSIYMTNASDVPGRRRLAHYAFEPSWSPDGRRIAYAAASDGCSQGVGIWMMRSDGSQKTPLVESPDEFTDYASPAWSPDGQRIVFAKPARSGFGPLFVLDLRTKRVRLLTRLPAAGPAWSPGGKRIAFAARATDGSTDIYLIDPDGSHLARLTKPLPSS